MRVSHFQIGSACAALAMVALSFGAWQENSAVNPQEIPAATEAKAGVKDFAWLEGTWTRTDETSVLEEVWNAPLADSVSGTFRWVRDGKTWMYELMTIEEEAEGVVLRLRHFERNLKPWEAGEALTYPLKSVQENEAVFENPEPGEGHPVRLRYVRDGDRLVVTLEEEKDPSQSFEFTRRQK